MSKPGKPSDNGTGSTRREFIHSMVGTLAGGVALTAEGSAGRPLTDIPAEFPPSASGNGLQSSGIATNYPPLLQGLRGQNDEAKDAVHALRDGDALPAPTELQEHYDLVVVGAGLSGLAAAYYYLKALPNSRVLILEACDDFGGHARRNEFDVDGHQLVAAGGTYFIQFPDTYTPEGKSLLQDIGIDAQQYYQARGASETKIEQYKLHNAVFFPRETYGEDRLVSPGLEFSGASLFFQPDITWPEFLQRTPLSEAARKDILRLVSYREDNMPGLESSEKIERLRRQSYADYMANTIGVGPDAMQFVQDQMGASSSNVGAGPDSFSAWMAYTNHLPGFDGLGLPAVQISGVVRDGQLNPDMHLPDGNGGVARLLVRWLIPSALPGNTMDDSVVSWVDYSQLDRAEHRARIRLGSAVVHVENDGDPDTAQSALITYLQNGRAYRLKAENCILACFNSVIPHLCPTLPEAQKDALHLAVRKPLVIATVALRNWRALARLKARWITSPGCFYYATMLDPGIDLGDYRSAQGPDYPATVMMMHVPSFPGGSARNQFRTGRERLEELTEEDYKRGVRDQLGRMLVSGGFDPDRDIAGITINRWAHGYACGGNDLYDPDWSVMDSPWVKGRQRFGRIAIANSDAAGVALTQAAFDQANRAVKDLLYNVVEPVFSTANPPRG